MIVDKDLEFSNAQAAFDTDDTVVSTNIVDLGATGVTHEEPLALQALVTTAFTGGTSIQVALYTDDDVAFGSATLVYSGPAVAVASAVAGYQFVLPNLTGLKLERYLRVSYVNVGANSAGAISAWLVKDKASNGPNPALATKA